MTPCSTRELLPWLRSGTHNTPAVKIHSTTVLYSSIHFTLRMGGHGMIYPISFTYNTFQWDTLLMDCFSKKFFFFIYISQNWNTSLGRTQRTLLHYIRHNAVLTQWHTHTNCAPSLTSRGMPTYVCVPQT